LGLNASYYLRPSNMARPSHTKQDKRQEKGQEMKHYHYIVKWSEGEGWQIDPDTESANFPNGTIYDEQEGWQFGYLGEGKFNGKEEELSEALTNLLNTANTNEREGKK